MSQTQLIDQYGRKITYVRMSVTDRCDFRCVYCMDEKMTFLPRDQVMSLEEIQLISRAFIELGVNKIRLTGGEPLVRRDVISLFNGIGSQEGLEDFCLTTNGSQLRKYAKQLKSAGVNRINVSLDSLNPLLFRSLTRIGHLDQVIDGIDAAIEAGIERIKLNAVVLKGRNHKEVLALVNFARDRGIDISFIEEMPLGAISSHDRAQTYFSSDDIKSEIEKTYTLERSSLDTGGPSVYWNMAGTDTKIGFISPHSHNFCGDCNRVRVTVEGKLLLCLGNENAVDLKQVVRDNNGDIDILKRQIILAMDNKPKEHHFSIGGEVQVVRFMNMTGG